MSRSNTNKEVQQVTNDIITPPNVISFIRLCLIPLFFFLLINSFKIPALIIFCLASITDFFDGYIARRFNYVSKLGQLLDPAVDTLLMISGVVATWAFFGLPAWVMILIFLREVSLLIAGGYLLKCRNIRIPVLYAGKVATALLFVGLASLFLIECGIYIVYVGLALQIIVTFCYLKKAIDKLKEQRR